MDRSVSSNWERHEVDADCLLVTMLDEQPQTVLAVFRAYREAKDLHPEQVTTRQIRRALAELFKSGYVAQRTSQRVYYFLTPRGIARAQQLRGTDAHD